MSDRFGPAERGLGRREVSIKMDRKQGVCTAGAAESPLKLKG